MAPQYLTHGQLTEKADVYSFGVLLLEIVTTWKKFQAGTMEELYDPNLMFRNHHDNNVQNDVTRVEHVGLLCTQEISSLRPTMSKALQMLTTEEHIP
uniref:Serine-threonine/tyrosine-protein kinase catalytic domain-containing protein n=1 Tax=Populus trichocarpa TaxID=3694 RepID=U5G2T0_POPTR